MDEIDDVTLINRSLGRIGSAPIFSLEEDSPLAGQALPVYFDRVDTLLASYQWSFAKKTYKLDRLPNAPENGWRYAFAMPGTALGTPRKVLRNPRSPDFPLRAFEIEEDMLCADEAEIWVQVTVRSKPNVWLPIFRELVVVAVASALAVPVAHDTTLKNDLKEDAFGLPSEQGRGGLFGRAMAADISGNWSGAAILASDPLTAARF